MRFKQRKELADKYKDWVKQSIDNNQTMILDCAESLLAWLDINGYLNEVVRCKDCKHRIMNEHYGEVGYMKLKAMCDQDTGDPFELSRCAEDDEWFCADGERRENDI